MVIDEAELQILRQMRDYDLKPGQMLLLGPLSCAYLRGDYAKAPWLLPNFAPPGGKRLPDKFVFEQAEWKPTDGDA